MYVFRSLVLLVCLFLNSAVAGALPTDVLIKEVNGSIEPFINFDMSQFKFRTDDLVPAVTYLQPNGKPPMLVLRYRDDGGEMITFMSRANDPALEERLIKKLWPNVVIRSAGDAASSVPRWFNLGALKGLWAFGIPLVVLLLFYLITRIRGRQARTA